MNSEQPDWTKTVFNIEGSKYIASTEPIEEGDLVFDPHDQSWGYIDQIVDGKHVSVRCTTERNWGAAEIGIPIDRVFKLVPYTNRKLHV